MIFKYILTDSELQIKLFNWTFKKISYQNIENVRAGLSFWSENWCNPWPWKNTIIKRKKGWIKNLQINPRDRENFIAQLRQKLASQ